MKAAAVDPTPADPVAGMAEAYSATGRGWQDGPGLVYDALAHVLVQHSPRPLQGAMVVDLGSGTGAGSRAAAAAGAAHVVAVDEATGMLAAEADQRPPAVAGTALALPLRSMSVDVVLAPFVFNHLSEPAAGFAEAARVVRPGGAIVASSYAEDDAHPVKAAVEAALAGSGWTAATWYQELRHHVAPQLATAEGCARHARAAGLTAAVHEERVHFPDLTPQQLVAWRLGMAHHAPFLATLSAGERAAIEHDALGRLGGDGQPLVRSVLITVAVR